MQPIKPFEVIVSPKIIYAAITVNAGDRYM